MFDAGAGEKGGMQVSVIGCRSGGGKACRGRRGSSTAEASSAIREPIHLKKINLALASTVDASTPGTDLRSARPTNLRVILRATIACATD